MSSTYYMLGNLILFITVETMRLGGILKLNFINKDIEAW